MTLAIFLALLFAAGDKDKPVKPKVTAPECPTTCAHCEAHISRWNDGTIFISVGLPHEWADESGLLCLMVERKIITSDFQGQYPSTAIINGIGNLQLKCPDTECELATEIIFVSANGKRLNAEPFVVEWTNCAPQIINPPPKVH